MKHNIKSTVQQIKENMDIVAIIGRYVQLTSKGARYVGLSPFKKENTPSFYVDPDKKFYYCFSTSQGGDVIRFIETVEHVDFMGAVGLLARELGIDIDAHSFTKKNDQESIRILDLCARIDKTFSYLFWKKENQHAYKYMSERGFSDEILNNFHVGFAPPSSDWLYNFLKNKGYANEELAESGLFSLRYEKYSLFRNRIMFPILTVSGQAIAYGGRLLEGTGPKYINSPETKFYKKKNTLYGLYQSIQTDGFKKLKKAFLVEGYLDVMALHQSGITTAVAPLGTAFTEEQAESLRKRTDSIVLVFDNDEAGLRAAIKSAIICEQVGFKSITVVELSENDPADVLKLYGKEELRTQVLEEDEFYDYYLNKIFPGVHSDIQEKEFAIKKIVEYMEVVQSPYKRAIYMAKTADLFQITVEMIVQILQTKKHISANKNEYHATENNHTEQGKIDYKKYPIVKNGELVVLAALCGLIAQEQKYLEIFRNSVKFTDMESVHARHIYGVLEELYRKNEVTFNEIMDALDKPVAHSIQSLIASGEASTCSKNILEDFITQIKLKRLKKRSKDIEFQLRTYNHSKITISKNSINSEYHNQSSLLENQYLTDDEKMTELLMEKQFINKEIAQLSMQIR